MDLLSPFHPLTLRRDIHFFLFTSTALLAYTM